MWSSVCITALCFFTSTLSKQLKSKGNQIQKSSIFKQELIIFSSTFNITKLLVPVDTKELIVSLGVPRLFFTVSDDKLNGGSCIYVLDGFAAYEILEGGRDATSDYGTDKTVYFGASDGLYKYNPETLSAKKFGIINDDIVQLQKANGSDIIYVLSEDKIYKVSSNATFKSRVNSIKCAREFVLDILNNIYYIDCSNNPNVVQINGDTKNFSRNIPNASKVVLLRPSFIMESCVPLFVDGVLYILYANGTVEKIDFYFTETPSAISIDSALYVVAASHGRIYEFNVMELLVKSMLGMVTEWPQVVSKIVISALESTQDGIMSGFFNKQHIKKFID